MVMFYDKQSDKEKSAYKNMLRIMGGLSRIFSEAEEPYLYYRAHENIFAKYFDVENNARSDDSADVYSRKEQIGIGLKTWVGQNNQKVAEFGKLRPQYEKLDGIELIKKISEYRNARINITKRLHGLKKLLYHIIKRIPGMMCIYEAAFESINIDNIVVEKGRGTANSIYFNDGKHTYHFSKSKNTLYMIFDKMELLDELNIVIYDDPYELLEHMDRIYMSDFLKKKEIDSKSNQLCLRLYSVKKDKKFVPGHSGLNQWNGVRRQYKTVNGQRVLAGETIRNENELYIPYPKEDRIRTEGFFPPRNISFELLLPDGQIIKAKVCQDDGKAIMSDPNQALGKWLLRDVLQVPIKTVVTYEMLQIFDIDSVIFTKISDCKYSIDFCPIGTYEKFYENK